ncbi:MAG: nucleoside triphosphate pyrophosphohydrolase [Pseudomonadota bacterium]|nr:nucleoside triphosphate pyrophosphohydrolase [Pseudomonadota bacterium]
MDRAYDIEDLKRLMERLRDPEYGCPWDLEQTYQSIAPFTLEECLELIDALEQSDYEHVKEELGDLLFQVIFYAQLGKEDGRFDFDSVVSGITAKLLRRHPHVFKDGELEGVIEDRTSMASIKANWEKTKAEERAYRSQTSIMDDVPATLGALSRAQKLQKRAATVGFDFSSASDVSIRLLEEYRELEQAMVSGDQNEIENELGDILFTVVNIARHLKVDSEAALRKASRRFEDRIRSVERDAAAEGASLVGESAERLDERWQKAKLKDNNKYGL